ncbi:hypothetical protein [Parapedobacter koreensis]|uniref:hypothetical protein n=1 Tax=Parapedobacter koreensis TaxID=332977 RepID=UPI000B87CBA6|nr:hypothetical protein [Parapedobacter koreensis]
MLLAANASCSNPDGSQSISSQNVYFSLGDYFTQEADRLQQRAPDIAKTVSKNGETESRDTRIGNWKNELELFIDSDINKPAWQHSYRIDSTATSLTYTSLDPALRTEQIRIEKDANDDINRIHIVNRVNNMLYQTNEQLDYYPDSLYRIIRKQQVRIIGASSYTVNGIIQ